MSNERPFKTGAPIYQAAGWTGIIPLPPKKKGPTHDYTGWNGKDPSAKMIETWCDRPSVTPGRIQHRDPYALQCVGIDVDHYGDKTGGDTLAELEADLGRLPATNSSTPVATASRESAGTASTPTYRSNGRPVPAKTSSSSTTVTATGRMAIDPPDTGHRYQWYDDVGQPRRRPSRPAGRTPCEWVARFTGGETDDGTDPVEPATDEQMSQCLTGGDTARRRPRASGSTSKSRPRPRPPRRHARLHHVPRPTRRTGPPGVDKGIDAVASALRQYAQGRDKYEVARAVDGAVAKVLAKPTAIQDKRCCGSTQNRDDIQALTTNLPEEFWSSRPVLGRIRRQHTPVVVHERCAVRHAGSHLCHGQPATRLRIA